MTLTVGTVRESRYRHPWRGFRVRVTRNVRRGDWAFGVGRSHWTNPRPNGMAMYVVHLLWWNLIAERCQ